MHAVTVTRADLTSRYVELVEQLGDKAGRAHGWRRRVAEQLGISESTLSKILKGTRVVGMDLAERATQRLKLGSDYFWAERHPEARADQWRAKPGQRHSIQALIAKFDDRTATVADIYALARAVAEEPSVLQAQEILKSRNPKSEQEIGGLFLAASKLIESLR
jgi:transcriptional regulator with XRE-family HTH domain